MGGQVRIGRRAVLSVLGCAMAAAALRAVASREPDVVETRPARTGEPEPSPPPGVDEFQTREMPPQWAAMDEHTHSDCYRRAMERRAQAEVAAHRAFESQAAAAAGAGDRLLEAADRYRLRLEAVHTEFAAATGRCRQAGGR